MVIFDAAVACMCYLTRDSPHVCFSRIYWDVFEMEFPQYNVFLIFYLSTSKHCDWIICSQHWWNELHILNISLILFFFVYFSFIYMHIRPGRIERNKLLGFCRNYAQNSFRISSHCHVIKLKYFKSWSFSKIKSYCGKRIKEIQE